MEKKNKKKKHSKLLNLLLLLLFLVGIALIFNQQIRYMIMSWNSGKYDASHYTVEQVEKNDHGGEFDFDAVDAVSTEAVLSAQFKNANLNVIGQIAIPDLKMHLPIFRGISNTVLLYGAGTMKPDEKMGEGNYSLASHRVDDPTLLFSPLQKAVKGQMIFITDLKKVYQYKTTSVRRVTPDHVEVLDDIPGRKIITLVTCNDPGAIRRVIVQGDLVDTKPLKSATKEMYAALKGHVNQGYW
ncbi:MAG: class A sortase [Streptococcaceae bacterium]|nr:class A sortase [Streptococcaceae bacterium]